MTKMTSPRNNLELIQGLIPHRVSNVGDVLRSMSGRRYAIALTQGGTFVASSSETYSPGTRVLIYGDEIVKSLPSLPSVEQEVVI